MAVTTIRLKDEEEEKELIDFLKDGEGNFELPRYFTIPKGERSISSRARLLMMAGLESLKKDYPKKNNAVKETNCNLEKVVTQESVDGWV